MICKNGYDDCKLFNTVFCETCRSKKELDNRNNKINAYAYKYIADNTDNDGVYHKREIDNKILGEAFKNCVIPASVDLYNDIIKRIKEIEP